MALFRLFLLFSLVIAVVLVSAQPLPRKGTNGDDGKKNTNFMDLVLDDVVDIDLLSGDDGEPPLRLQINGTSRAKHSCTAT